MAAQVGTSYADEHTGYQLVSLDDLTPYKIWVKNSYGRNGLTKGVPVPEHFFPKRLQFEKGNKLFDYCGYAALAPILSTRLKDLIEAIEPGVHQFVPVEVLHRDGTHYSEIFWHYVICSTIDAVNPVLGGVSKRPWANGPEDFHWDIDPGGRSKLAVHKDRVAGRAMWRDKRFKSGQFFSDALLDGMRAQGMDGWKIETSWPEL